MQKRISGLIVFLLFFGIGYSQSTTSNIKGSVFDDKNQQLIGATILAVHQPTGTKYSVISNENGKFSILNMRVGGPYTITGTFIGKEAQKFENISLELGKTTSVDFILIDEANMLQDVVIKGSKSKIFNSDRTGSETVIGRKELTALPSISRSAQDFTRLDPTASGGSFGGRNDQFNNYSLNGAIFNNPFGLDAATPGGQTETQPISIDAIEQIQVSVSPYDVTQSGFTGASVNAVTKSGTNEIKGTAYTFGRNQDLTGSKVKGEKIFVPSLKQTQAGFSIGAPIKENKMFVFANFEIDDRSDLGSNYIANNNDGITEINESRVLESDLIAVSNALRSIGYETGSFQGYTHYTKSNKGIIKLDWNINDNNRLAIIYNFLNASKDKNAHPTALGYRGPNFNTIQFRNSGYQINNEIDSFLAELNSNISSNITNKVQIGYTNFKDYRNPFSTPAPVINITKEGTNYIIAGHEPFSIHNQLDQKVYQFTNNLNIVKGNHNYTLGTSFEKFMFKNSFNLVGYGFDIFGSVDLPTFFSNITNGYYADAISNATTIYNTKNNLGAGVDNGWNLAEVNVGQYALYGQDEWSVSDNFKLTYGIRGDKPLYFDTSDMVQKYIDTENGAIYTPNTTYYNPNTGMPTHFDSTKMPSSNWLLSPRVGFNIDINGDKTLQIRGGSGLFTGRFPFVWIGNQVSSVDSFFYQVVSPDFKFPQVYRASLGADIKLKNGIIMTTDLSYNKDINAIHVQNWGLKSPSGTLSGVDSRAIYETADHATWITPWGATLPANAYVLVNSRKGYAVNASTRLQKTFKNGLYASLAYNYMDSRDVNSIEAEITGDAFAFNPVVGNVNNDNLAHSKYGDDHRIVGVITKKWTYGNWATSVASFYEYARGGRFSYTYAGDINGDGSSVNDLIYIPTASDINSMNFTAADQGVAFNDYISQDDYLNAHRGQYAERYAALSPWRGRIDFKFLQDYNFKFSKSKTNTIQFSIDVLNLGNLINSNWGVVQQPNSVQPIEVAVIGNVPTYTFTNTVTKTFGYDASLASRWQVDILI